MKTRRLFYRVVAVITLITVLLFLDAITQTDAQADGPITFTEHTIAGNFDTPYSVYATDVDGDGDVDILGAAAIADNITWWENDGSENFAEHTIAGSFDGAWSVYATDVDGDGDVDVLGAAYYNGISWWENDSSENFTEHAIAGSFDGARSVYATDVDGDGDVDVLGAAYIADDITWWENDGNENFSEHTITGNFDGAQSVYAADIDGDGDVDILSGASLDDVVTWWENDGSENFTEHTIYEVINFSITSVYATDMDDDGDVDVLCGSPTGSLQVTWFENDGSGNFTIHDIDIEYLSGDAWSVYATDVDGDGDVDVLFGTGSKIGWLENDGSETFTEYTIAVSEFRSVYATDVDGDGNVDVLGADLDNNHIVWWENGGGPVQVNSITFDQAHYNVTYGRYFYERSKNTVQTTVNMTSMSGGSFNVVTQMTDINGNSTDLPTQAITLSPGETRDLVFNWTVPVDATMLDYDVTVEVRETGNSAVIASKSMNDAFMVSGVSNQELNAVHSECFSTGVVCATATFGVIPYAGIPANWLGLKDTLCQFTERGQNGDIIGCIMSLARVINAAAEVVHDTIGAITGVGELTSALHSAIGGAADCAETALHDYVVNNCGPEGYTCLAKEMLRKIGTILSEKITIVIVSPSGSSSSSAMDSISAMAYNPSARIRITDSTGDYVEFNSSGQIVVDGVGMIYEIGADTQIAILEGQGSYKDIKITGLTNSTIDVNVLQVTEDGTVALATYESISTTLTSIATIHLTTNQTSSDLQLDTDGNGSTDQVISPTDVSTSPSAPTGLTATLTDTGIDLSWNVSNNATGYKVYYDNDGSGSPYAYGDSATEGPSPIDVGNITSYQLTNLPSGTYYMTITALDENGNESGYSNEVMVSTQSNVYLPIILK